MIGVIKTPHKNYQKIYDSLLPNEEKSYAYIGDFFDIVYVSTSLEDLQIKFYNGEIEQDWFRADEILPTNTPFTKIKIKNIGSGSVTFYGVIGREFFSISRQSISIIKDLVGLGKESTLQSILNQLDITLSALRDAITTGSTSGATAKALYDLYSDLEALKKALASIGTDKLLTTPDNPPNLDIALSSLINPILNTLVLNGATVQSAGDSGLLDIKGAKHVDVLIYVGGVTGSPSITFHLQVIENQSGQVIRTYDGNTLTSAGADYITVDALTLGDTIKITWDGTLSTSDYVTGVYCRVIAKR